MHNMPRVFDIDRFVDTFPCFIAEGSGYTTSQIARAGKRAQKHIGEDVKGFPLKGEDREYALFLMTAHILVLDKKNNDAIASGGAPSSGLTFKSSIGPVSTENTKPNSFTMDDWSYWLTQTVYGSELIALLETVTSIGIYVNSGRDSVRVLK